MEIQQEIDYKSIFASPQTPERAEVAAFIETKFEEKRLMRDQSQPLFRDRTLKAYIDDCTKRFIQFKRRPAHKKLWQSNLASSTPNEKLIGILSKIATKEMEAKVHSLKDLTIIEIMREKILNFFLKAASIKNDDAFQLVLEMLEAGEKGVIIGFEDWYHGKKQIRDVVSQDQETGEVKFNIKTIKEWNDVRSSLVNIEDFYPGEIQVRPGKIQDMDDCFLVTDITEDQFRTEFKKYPDADKVQCWDSVVAEGSTPFWKQSPDQSNDMVRVKRYFNKKTDEYVIVAGGIWINYIKGTSKVQPLPWNHKKLPFWAAVFEPFDANFFYGRSFIDKLISLCDSGDALFDRILDQMTIAANQTIVTDGTATAAISKGFMQPGNIITTDWTNGRPNFEVVPVNEPGQMGVTLWQLIQQQKEHSTISSENIGGTSVQNKTATQVDIEAQGASDLVSLFRKLMEFGQRDKIRLRLPNICQFYSMPIHDKDGDKFKKIKLKNVQTTDGRTGAVQISINPNPSQINTVAQDSAVPVETEFIEITPDFIRDFEGDVEIVEGSSIKHTEEQEQQAAIAYAKTMLELFPDITNRSEAFDDVAKAFRKNPEKSRAEQPAPQNQDLSLMNPNPNKQLALTR